MQDLDNLNNSELRALCEQMNGGNRFISPWVSREHLVAYLESNGETPFPHSPIDGIRVHQINEIMNKIEYYRSQIPAKIPSGEICNGNCFEHCDMRVVECQISNPTLRHSNY